MPHHVVHGLVKKQQLEPGELAELQLLVMRCEQHEPLCMRVVWHVPRGHTSPMSWDFLYYENGALVGYLTLDGDGGEVCELFGLVHPAYRRRGIFSQLFKAAREECRAHGVKELVLICEQSSASGQAFVAKTNATYLFSEHEMMLNNFQPRYAFDDRLVMAPATSEDIDALVMVQSESFGDPPEAVRRRVLAMMSDPACHYYLVTFGEEDLGCREPVASLRLEYRGDEVGIYAFGVLPAYRGRGYGRQVLEETIFMVRNDASARNDVEPRIMLNVRATNIPAVALYRSCGFQIRATYDFYMIGLC